MFYSFRVHNNKLATFLSFNSPRHYGKTFQAVFILALALFFSGCATTTSVEKISKLERAEAPPKILLMPIDVQLSILTAGGLTEPQAEWTDNARRYMVEHLEKEAQARQANLIYYEGKETDPDSIPLQLEKLHQVVGSSIMMHHYIQPAALPTKKGVFDWTLGKDAKQLKQDYDADYALFVFVRDSYSSGGRVALQIIGAVAGVGISGGMQVGFASLVDLETGDIVWFNRLINSAGDLRTPSAAALSVKNLLKTLPGA